MGRKIIGIVVQRILKKDVEKTCCSCGKSIGVHERFIEVRNVKGGCWVKSVFCLSCWKRRVETYET
jgi:hypothetical protein